MPGNDNNNDTTPPTPRNVEPLLSTAHRLSNDPNAKDEHHLASLAILSRMTTTTAAGTTTTTTKSNTVKGGAGNYVDGVSAPSSQSSSQSPPPPDPRDVEYALGHGGIDFLARLVSTYVSSIRKRGNTDVDEAMDDAGGTDGGGGGRADRSDDADTTDDAYLSLAVSVASYLASEESPGCRGVLLPAVFDVRLMSRLIDALRVRAELYLPLEEDVDGRILSIFTGAAVHLMALAEMEEEEGEAEENDARVEEIMGLLPRCAEEAVSRLFRRTRTFFDRDGVMVDDDAGGSHRRAYYSEQLSSFLRSYLILVRTRTRHRRRHTRRSHPQSRPLPLLPPTSTLLDLLEMNSSSAGGGCGCVDLHELSLLWITEVLTHEVAVEGLRTTDGDEAGHGGLVDLLRGAKDRRASNALRRCILLGIMGMIVTRSSDDDDDDSKSRQHSRLTTTDGDMDHGGSVDDVAAAARLRNASYGTLAVAMEVCGGRWLLEFEFDFDVDDDDPSSSSPPSNVANGRYCGSSSVGSGSLSALVRMACGELRIVLEGRTASSSSSSSRSRSLSQPAETKGSRGGTSEERWSSLLDLASNCVRVIIATVGLLVRVSSTVEEDEGGAGTDHGGRRDPMSSATTQSPRPKADWEELLAGHDGINTLLEIRCSLNGALGSCLAFLASCVPEKLGEGRELPPALLGPLCSRCVGALLAETEVDEVVASVASASSSSTDGEGGGAVAVVADAVRNAVVVLCCRRPRIDGATTTTEREEESAAKASSLTAAAADWGEPLVQLLPALAKMLSPDGDGDGDAGGQVAERLAGDRVVVECVASYVHHRFVPSSSPLNPPDGVEVADDAMDTDVRAELHGGSDAAAAAVETFVDVNNPPHAGLRWALLVFERWWWWWNRHLRRDHGRTGRSSAGRRSTSCPARADDGCEEEETTARRLLILGAVAECAGALTDRVRRRTRAALARGRRTRGEMVGGEEAAAGDDAREEREDRISLCVAIQTWFSIWVDDDDENGTVRPNGLKGEDDGGELPYGGFHDETSLAVVARAMETTFALPVPRTNTKPDEEALALEVARTAATVEASVSGRSGFELIFVGFGGLDGSSVEELWRAVGRWSRVGVK